VTAAVAHAAALIESGADIIDVGGESTRPGAAAVAPAEEIARVVPVIEAVTQRWPDAVLSADTVKSEVARAAIEAGAAIVNDVSGLRLDAELGAVVARSGAGLILMHSRGSVESMARYELAAYGDDVVTTVKKELAQSVAHARAAGVPEENIVIDPGLGFAKTTAHSLALLAGLDDITSLGHAVLIGPSRKRFVGDASGGVAPEERLEGTLAACVIALLKGARLFRVHDVAPVRRALLLTDAVRRAGGDA
jgi:dihydropteroate synthase